MKSDTQPLPTASEGRADAWRITAQYAALAALWVVVSNGLLAWVFSDITALTLASTLKGWLFVLVTSALLFVLVSRLIGGFNRNLQLVQKRGEVLAESQRLLLQSQQIVGLGSYSFDLNAGYWQTSAVADRLLGLDAHYVRNMDGWRQLVHPLDWDWLLAHFNSEVLIKARPFALEYRIIRPSDGAERWIGTTGEVECDSQGRPLRLIGTMQDVTEQKRALAQINEARSKLQTTLDAQPDLFFEVGPDGRIHQCHSRRPSHPGDLLVTPTPASVGKLLADVLPPDAVTVCRRAMDEAAARGFASGLCYSLPLPQGERWFELAVAPMAPVAGQRDSERHFMCTARDVTERKNADRQLELASLVFNHAHEAIMVTDAEGTLVEVNQAFTRISGYDRNEVIGMNARLLGSGRHGNGFFQAMWTSLEQAGHWRGEVWNRHKDGPEYAALLTISVARGSGSGLRYVAQLSDITLQKRYQHELETIAHYDAVTGLPNQLLLTDRLQQAMAQALRRDRKLMVACLDLDGFKSINEAYGHVVGDKLLKALGHRLIQQLREGDTMARLGGAAFVAILVDAGEGDAVLPLVNRLIDAAAEPFHIDGLQISISASVGLCAYPQALELDGEQLLHQANLAMYQAKRSGQNRHHISAA